MNPPKIEAYRLESVIGRGGKGVVYLAEDERLARPVALKVFPPELDGEWLREKVEREADLADRLQHPGICAVHDAGVSDGRPYIAMRFVEGESLAERLDRGAPIEDDTILRLIEETARTIQLAHEVGVIHRDLKPQNIMITPEGTPVILDFGSARDAEQPVLNGESEGFAGTPAYAAPEQIDPVRGLPDRRSDVYALGVILYECLTRHRPFTGTGLESIFHSVLSSRPRPPSDFGKRISRDLETVVLTALAKEQDARYQTALDLAEDLRRVRTGEAVSVRRAGLWKQYGRWLRRRPALAGGVTALITLLVVGIGLYGSFYRQNRLVLAATRRLSDYRALPDLVRREAQGNWPIQARGVPAMDAWIAEAEALLQRRSGHDGSMEADVTFLADLDELDLTVARVREGREEASRLRARTVDDRLDEWIRVIEAIADVEANPQYAGLRIQPQEGLVPLGQDPGSRLFEFGHIQSGALPRRDPTSGRLSVTSDSGFVLVLLPGGTFRMGAQLPSFTRTLAHPNVDPLTQPNEGPPHEVELAPFLLSKYEGSIGQWVRLGGSVPVPERDDEGQAWHPVGSLGWETVMTRLGRRGLTLPTEAQMEYATRAGSTSMWWPGNDFIEVQALEWVQQGSHVAVFEGSPNPFGLLHVHGNQYELVLDWFGSYKLPVRDGDGLRQVEHGTRHVFRGGGTNRKEWTRSAYRGLGDWAGFRPARGLDPPPER